MVWNVFAAPELSLQLKQWCYPVVGCAGYRGYFDPAAAEAAAAELRATGLEVNVAGVPAYSTLGWFSDPLLNTFIGGTEGQVAGLVFHELAHQVVFVGGDTTFNESFATAVEREGVQALAGCAGRRLDAPGLRRVRAAPLAVSGSPAEVPQPAAGELLPAPSPNEAKRARKQQLFAELKQEYVRLKESWGGYSGYDRYFAQDLTNAHLAAVGAYNDLVPAFDALLAQSNGNMPAFYSEVKRIAALPKAERDAALNRLQPSSR